jgi:hypothetical protein
MFVSLGAPRTRLFHFHVLLDKSTPTRRHQPQIYYLVVRTDRPTTSCCKRSHQFGGILFVRVVSPIVRNCGKHLLLTIVVEAGYGFVSITGHGIS